MPSFKETRLLLDVIDQAYDHRSWHGTNLRGALRGVSASQAAWRPMPGRHNICELVVHSAYWKYVTWRRLTGQRRGAFPLKGSNWFKRSGPLTDQAWKDDVDLLARMHAQLREAVEHVSDRELGITPRGTNTSNAFLLTGIAAHDLYHAGQIQLLKRLARRRPGRSTS